MTRMLPLTVYAEHELQDAAAGLDGAGDVAVSAGHLAESRSDVGIRAAVAEVGHVENVERRRAELHIDAFPNDSPLYHAGVEEAVPVLANGAAPAELAWRCGTNIRLGLVQVGRSLAADIECR